MRFRRLVFRSRFMESIATGGCLVTVSTSNRSAFVSIDKVRLRHLQTAASIGIFEYLSAPREAVGVDRPIQSDECEER